MFKNILLILVLSGLCAKGVEIFGDYVSHIKSLDTNGIYAQDIENNVKKLLAIEPNYFNYSFFNSREQFPCDVNYDDEKTVPTSVHKLRPRDIKVFASMGDSITAGFGINANTLPGLLMEDRGRSWSIGGDESVETIVTLPNIVKKFNPKITGYSTGSNVVFIYNKGRALNQAVSSSEANNMPGQAAELIKKIKAHPDIDYHNDWKIITLFVGGNDLCRFCFNRPKFSPQNYIGHIKDAIDLFYKEVPRVFFNLVPVLKVEQIIDLNEGLACSALHVVECKCGAYPTASEKLEIKEYTRQYQNFTQALADSGIYDGRDDFTVVGQPFFTQFEAPKLPNGDIDLSYMAPDCFHLSGKGHAAAAVGLWNNMLQPVGKKSNAWKPGDKLSCPTKESPYFFTNKNSN